MSRALALTALLVVLAPLARAADPPPTDDDPGIDDSGLDADAPKDDGSHLLGGDFADAKLGLSLPSPGPEWTRIAPVPGSSTLIAAFLHANGAKIRAVIGVGVDPKANGKDV